MRSGRLPAPSPLAVTPPSKATMAHAFDFTAEQPPKRQPGKRPSGRGLCADVWTEPMAAMFPAPAPDAEASSEDAEDADEGGGGAGASPSVVAAAAAPSKASKAKKELDPWPAMCGPKPSLADPTVDPCARQVAGALPRNWSQVRAVNGAWEDGTTSGVGKDDGTVDSGSSSKAKQAAKKAKREEEEEEAGRRDGFQFDAEEELYTLEQLARARAKMKVHAYEGKMAGCSCAYSYQRKTETLAENSSFSFVLKSHQQLQGWFVWEGPQLSGAELTAQISPMRGAWMIRHTAKTSAEKTQALADQKTRLVFSCQKLWADLKSAKQTGEGNPLADSMRSNEHELYELRILKGDKLVDNRLFQVTDEQEIVMQGARKSGRERRQKRHLSPERLGEGEAHQDSDTEQLGDTWSCYNCLAENSSAEFCKQCDELKSSEKVISADLRKKPQDGLAVRAQTLPLAMAYDERFVATRKAGAGTRSESLAAAYDCLSAQGLLDGTITVPPRAAARVELALAHDPKYLDAHEHKLPETAPEDAGASLEDALAAVEAQAAVKLSIAQASALSAGTAVDVLYSVISGRAFNGVALIRPCGAHIDRAGSPSGGVNVLAVAARSALRNGAKRVLVVDWAVAHGIGTQRICFDDPSIVTVSMHGTTDRQQRAWVQCDSTDCRKWRKLPVGVDVPASGKWYCSMNPDRNCDRCQAMEEKEEDAKRKGASKESDAETVGKSGKAEGKNVNLTWPANGMGDADYVHAATKLLLPIVYDHSPDVVIVGPRFDAANGARRSDEPCGHDKLSPAGFAQVLALLHTAVPGRIVLLCEGGNNLRTTCESLVQSVRVLKGEQPQRLRPGLRPRVESIQAVSFSADQLEQFWRGLHHASLDASESDEEEEEEAPVATATVLSAASLPPVAAATVSAAEIQLQIRQLQLQLQLTQSSPAIAAAIAAEPAGGAGKKRTPPSVGADVVLADGRRGVFRGSGNGYMHVELASAKQTVHVRSADVSLPGESAHASSGRSSLAEDQHSGASAADAVNSAGVYVNVKLHDGRAGKMLSSGHGYVRVALNGGKVLNVRAVEIIDGAILTKALEKAQGSSKAVVVPSSANLLVTGSPPKSSSGAAAAAQPAQKEANVPAGRAFKKGELVSCPGCKQRLRTPSSVACFVLKCAGCAFVVTPQTAARPAPVAAPAAAAGASPPAAVTSRLDLALQKAKQGQPAKQAAAAHPKASVGKTVRGETLETLMTLPLATIRGRLGCSPNTHKSKAHLVGQLAKKLGILSNGAASPTATAAAAAAATTLPVAARQSSPNKAAASDGSPAANAGGELKRSAPPTPAHGPEPEASKKPKLSHAAAGGGSSFLRSELVGLPVQVTASGDRAVVATVGVEMLTVRLESDGSLVELPPSALTAVASE